jgi:hypothetical protein
MPTVVLRPTAVGTFYNQVTYVAGGTKVQAVDPGASVTHDDYGSYIAWQPGETNFTQLYIHEDLPPSAARIETVTQYVRWRHGTGVTQGIQTYAKRGGYSPDVTAGDWTQGGHGAWVTEAGKVYALAPGNLPWTPQAVNETEFGLYVYTTIASDSIVVTSHWIEVAYRTAAGAFVHLVI